MYCLLIYISVEFKLSLNVTHHFTWYSLEMNLWANASICSDAMKTLFPKSLKKSWPVAGSAVCPPPPTTMTALVLSRGVDSRAQTPTSRCSRRDVSCSALRPTSMCTELNFVEHTHRTAVKRRQSADSRGPTLRDLALGAHHHRLLFNLKTYRKTARDFAHSVLGGTLVTAGLRITQSLKEHKIIIKHISSLMI